MIRFPQLISAVAPRRSSGLTTRTIPHPPVRGVAPTTTVPRTSALALSVKRAAPELCVRARTEQGLDPRAATPRRHAQRGWVDAAVEVSSSTGRRRKVPPGDLLGANPHNALAPARRPAITQTRAGGGTFRRIAHLFRMPADHHAPAGFVGVALERDSRP